MNAAFVRAAGGVSALACVALFAVRTSPTLLEAREAYREAGETLIHASEALDRIPREPGVPSPGDWRRMRIEAASFLAGDLSAPLGEPSLLAADRKALVARISGPELPERLLTHLLPEEPWEREGRAPTMEEAELGWRKLRLASVLLETLVSKGVTDFGFLVFPDGGRAVKGPGAGEVRVKIRYAALARVQGEALAALLARRERGPFLVPDRLVLSPDPSGGRSDALLVLLEAHAPLLAPEER